MDNTIDALAEIEARAEKILEHAISEQKMLSNKHASDIKKLEQSTKANTEKAIKELKDNLNKELREKLDNTKQENEETLLKIEKLYNNKHNEIVNKLFAQITAM